MWATQSLSGPSAVKLRRPGSPAEVRSGASFRRPDGRRDRSAPSTDAGDPGFAHQPGDALAAGTHAPGAPLGLGAGCPIGAVRDGVEV